MCSKDGAFLLYFYMHCAVANAEGGVLCKSNNCGSQRELQDVKSVGTCLVLLLCAGVGSEKM